MKIREATTKDSNEILPLWISLMEFHADRTPIFKTAANFKEQVNNDIVKLIEKPNTKIFVAESNQLIIGFSTATISTRPTVFSMTKKGHIGETFVDSNYRDKGIGTNLLTTVREWFISQDVDLIDLQVTITNEAGMKFWRKNGFETVNLYMVNYLTK
jgi:ribosomal protein S18 acetylase RimI-like enzyme